MRKIIQISEMDSGELISQIKSVVMNTIKEVKELDFAKEEVLITRNEACQMLKVDQSTLYRWINNGIISSYGLSNRIYFLKSELLEQVKQNKINHYPYKLSA